MLCYDGQLGNGSIATHFILLSRPSTSSATNGYVVVPEKPSRNGAPTSTNEEQTMQVPSSNLVLPQSLFNELLCILPVLEHELLSYLVHFFYFHRNLLMNYLLKIFQLWKTFDVMFLLMYIFCRRGNKRVDVHVRRIRPVRFLLKDGDVAAC